MERKVEVEIALLRDDYTWDTEIASREAKYRRVVQVALYHYSPDDSFEEEYLED